jgi:uncharacterized protein YjiS (DUF1127 family)
MTTRTLNPSTQVRPFIDALGRILSAPVHAAQRAGEAIERSREKAQFRAELATLDPHLLADIGLRRSLINPDRFCQQPQS